MDIVLVVCGLILCLVGILGSVLPVLPGPPFGWLGLLCLELTDAIPNNYWFLGFTLIIALGIFILDYFIPAIGAKKFGGSRAGAIGTIIGLIIGLISPIPFGVLIGAFVGALIGEMVFNNTKSKQAFKAAFGAFLGFLTSTFMKLVISLIFLGLFLWDFIKNWNSFF